MERMRRSPRSFVPALVLTFAMLAVVSAQGQSNLPPSLFNSSDRAQELIQGPSADTLDPRVDTMHVFTRVDVMPESMASVTSLCTGQIQMDRTELEPDCLQHTKVYLRFIVERDGKTTSPAVVKGACPTLDRVALSCLDVMPRWQPGLLKGVPVRVQMVYPVQFELR